MADNARSSSPAVQAQLDRLWALSPGADILGLERITQLLDRLGNPQRSLPPVFHVAGTNGKGSTCAFLRAAIEAAGLTVHAYTSPHLVRFNERIRVADRLIDDDLLAALLEEVLDVSEDLNASFFEVTTAVAFLAFARVPADACVTEVGLGGRLDATNVIEHPAVTGIAQLGIDHQSFLGDTIEEIAGEKAGIAKRGAPLVTMAYPPRVAARVATVAGRAGATLLPMEKAWRYEVTAHGLRYESDGDIVETGLPRLPGPHQADNLALAIAMLRHQRAIQVPVAAIRAAAEWATWPARMQLLGAGPLADLAPARSSLWLDGGHNAAAAHAIARTLAQHVAPGQPVHLVLGMLSNKDPRGLLGSIAPLARSVTAVPVPDHEHHAPAALAEIARDMGLHGYVADDPAAALRLIAANADPDHPPAILILGSLYLAGAVLAANEQVPD